MNFVETPPGTSLEKFSIFQSTITSMPLHLVMYYTKNLYQLQEDRLCYTTRSGTHHIMWSQVVDKDSRNLFNIFHKSTDVCRGTSLVRTFNSWGRYTYLCIELDFPTCSRYITASKVGPPFLCSPQKCLPGNFFKPTPLMLLHSWTLQFFFRLHTINNLPQRGGK